MYNIYKESKFNPWNADFDLNLRNDVLIANDMDTQTLKQVHLMLLELEYEKYTTKMSWERKFPALKQMLYPTTSSSSKKESSSNEKKPTTSSSSKQSNNKG